MPSALLALTMAPIKSHTTAWFFHEKEAHDGIPVHTYMACAYIYGDIPTEPQFSSWTYSYYVWQSLYNTDDICTQNRSPIARQGVYMVICDCHGPLTRYITIACPGMPGTFSHHQLQRKPQISDPSMHHGTYVTHADICHSVMHQCTFLWRRICFVNNQVWPRKKPNF